MTLKIVGTKYTTESFIDANAVGFRKPIAIRFKGGCLSPGAYINNRALPTHPEEWRNVLMPLIGQAFVMKKDFDVIASVATGGIIHGGTIAWEVGKPHVIVKKQEKKGHGLAGLIDGDSGVLHDARVLLVEDMSTTFGSSLDAIEVLTAYGARVTRTFLLNTWNFPLFQANTKDRDVWALCTGEMLLDATKERGIDYEYEKLVRRWLANPEDERWAHDGTWQLPEGEGKST